jgi:hypothetical protein
MTKFYMLEINARFRLAGAHCVWIKTSVTAARVEHEMSESYIGPFEPVTQV